MISDLESDFWEPQSVVESGLLFSVVGNIYLLHLIVKITQFLIIVQNLGIFFPRLIELVLFFAKTANKKSEILMCSSMKLFYSEVVTFSKHLPSDLVFNTVIMPELVSLISAWKFWRNWSNRHVGILLLYFCWTLGSCTTISKYGQSKSVLI